MQVLVRENNVDQALRVLKKKMQREGVFREMKLRSQYEKPSERRVRDAALTAHTAWRAGCAETCPSSLPRKRGSASVRFSAP